MVPLTFNAQVLLVTIYHLCLSLLYLKAGERLCMGLLSSVQLAIYSEADRLQPHRYKADESYEVGGPGMTPVQCYLDYEGILALAKLALRLAMPPS